MHEGIQMRTPLAAMVLVTLLFAPLMAAEAPQAQPGAPAPQPARPLADYFAADTLVYADCPSVPAFIDGAKGTGLYALWNDESMAKLRAYCDENLQKQDTSDKAWRTLTALRDFAGSLPGRVAVGVGQGEGGVQWLVVADVSPDDSKTRATVAEIVNAGASPAEPQEAVLSGVKVSILGNGSVYSTVSDGLLLLGSQAAVSRALERRASTSPEGSLASSVNFAKASKFFSNGATAYRVVVDLPALMGMLRTAAAAAPFNVDALLAAIGIGDVETLSFEGTFQYSGVVEHVYVSTKTAESKLIDLVGRAPLDETRLSVAPKTSIAASARTVDLKLCWDAVTEILKLVGPAAGIDASKLIADLEMRTGVKIQEDVIASLGKTVITYTDMPEGANLMSLMAGGGANQAILIEAVDAQKIGEIIDKFAAAAQNDPTFLASLGRAGRPGPRIETTTLGDLKITSLVVANNPMLSPSVAVSNGFFIYANNKDTVKTTIDRLIAPGTSLVDTTDYTRVRGALSKQATQLGYLNLDRLVDFLYEVAVPELNRKIDAAKLNGQTTLTSAAIPPAFVIKKYLDGVGTSMSASGNLVDIEMYSPTGVLVVIPMAVALPAVAGARGRAPVTTPAIDSSGAIQSAPDAAQARLTRIGATLQVATIERKGRFPDRIEDAVPAEMLKAPQAPADDKSVDYIYVPGLTMASPGRSILVYEREGLQPEGRHVLFVDGSVELLSEGDFEKLRGTGVKE